MLGAWVIDGSVVSVFSPVLNCLPLAKLSLSDECVGEVMIVEAAFPKCQACKKGDLLPLSDFGGQGAPIHYKAWVCTNPDCGFNIKIRNGNRYLNEPISSGTDHIPRGR